MQNIKGEQERARISFGIHDEYWVSQHLEEKEKRQSSEGRNTLRTECHFFLSVKDIMQLDYPNLQKNKTKPQVVVSQLTVKATTY